MDTKTFLLKRELLAGRMASTRSETSVEWLKLGSTLFGAGLGLVMSGSRLGWVERFTQKLASRWLFRPLLGLASKAGLSKYIPTDLINDVLTD